MHPLIIAANIILSPDKSQVLLILRKKSPYANHYAFIGGKTEFGETLQVSLLRETLEESGIEIKNPRPVAILNETFQQKTGLAGHFLVHYWVSFSEPFPSIENREGTLKWHPVHSLPNPMVPSDKKILDFVLQDHLSISLIEGTLVEKKDGSLHLSEWMMY